MTGELAARRMERNAVAINHDAAQAIEQVLIKGDLKTLTPEQRNTYYLRLCEATGLNPLTQPFEYLTLNGKLVLYAKKACTDQLRALHDISVVDMDDEERRDVCIVTVKVQNGKGRTDMGKGAVSVAGLKGEAFANAIMKAETKAKRRATLSICGLGLLDETEVESIPAAARVEEEAAPLNSNQAKKTDMWPRFVERCRSFDDINDLDAWWESATTQRAVRDMPSKWQTEATEEYEKMQEKLADKLQADLDRARAEYTA